MRLAERPSPWRYVLVFFLLLAALVVLHWIDQEDEEPAHRAAATSMASIHLKLRPGAVAMAGATPVFRHVAASAAAWGDPRTLWMELSVPRAQAEAVLARLQHDPNIAEAYLVPVYSLPSAGAALADDSCPIHTPSYEARQGYLGPAPYGIDAPAAWSRNARGAGVWFADIEGNWNANHEDLPGDRITHAGGRRIADYGWRAHGTAVLGEVVGRDNGKGVTGIAPEVERVFTSSIGGTTVADAIDVAASSLRVGDVLLIELQATGPRGRFLPVEFWDDNFDAIQLAARRGVVVIEAAGNGGENLDHKTYRGKLERATRDSGAIMVGAGGPPRDGYNDRERLDFSNYGTRVDVQGWGRKVATLDYGDLQSCTGTERGYTDRHYTDEFSGTSSASPIVAGAAVLLESYAKARGQVLSPKEVRDLLVETGTPQAGGVRGFSCVDRDCSAFSKARESIGPRPDLAAALRMLEAR